MPFSGGQPWESRLLTTHGSWLKPASHFQHTLLSQAFLPTLLEGLCIEALLHGNMDAGEAAELARSVHVVLGGATVPADTRAPERCVQLPKGCSMLHRWGQRGGRVRMEG